jgi:hypothetical protein
MARTLLWSMALAACVVSLPAHASLMVASPEEVSKAGTTVLLPTGTAVGGDANAIYKQAMSIAQSQITAAFMPPTVPEPPTTWLVGAALALSVFLRARKRK